MENLATTNLLLGIMAAVQVLWTLGLIAAGAMGYRMYQNAMQTIKDLEKRQIEPLVVQVNEILGTVRGVTARVSEQTERVDHALRDTIERVDETAERVRSSVRAKAGRVVGIFKGIRAGIESLLRGEPGRGPSAEAPGRV